MVLCLRKDRACDHKCSTTYHEIGCIDPLNFNVWQTQQKFIVRWNLYIQKGPGVGQRVQASCMSRYPWLLYLPPYCFDLSSTYGHKNDSLLPGNKEAKKVQASSCLRWVNLYLNLSKKKKEKKKKNTSCGTTSHIGSFKTRLWRKILPNSRTSGGTLYLFCVEKRSGLTYRKSGTI